MNLRSLREVCDEQGISVPRFPFLTPDADLYSCLLLQPQGEVTVTVTSIGDAGQEARLSTFLELAITENVDLATCPEYCCPWSVIEEKIAGDQLPAQGCLWVLGAASITPAELQELEARLSGVRFVYDEPWCHGTGSFLDPVCLIFRQETGDPVVVIQFKQAHMGTSPEPIERDGMIHGREGYYIENDGASIRLAVVLCSDSLCFTPVSELPEFPTRSYLLLHLQLNPSPRQAAFAAYRSNIFDCNTDSVEVLSVNWATETRIMWPTVPATTLGFPHSAAYWKSKGLQLDASTLLQNHRGGAYYFFWRERYSHVFVLHDEEHCLRFAATKPSQVSGSPATSVRSGLQVLTASRWDGGSWILDSPSDGFDCVLSQTKLSNSAPMNSLDRLELEQFVSLCSAEVSGVAWHRPDRLEAFRFGTDETLRRVGFCRDPDSHPTAITRLAKVAGLLNVFSQATPPLSRFSPLLHGSVVDFSSVNRCCNIHKGGAPFAAGAYVGDDAGGLLARRATDAIRSIFGGAGRTPIFVWYREDSSLLCTSTADDTSIADVPQDGATIV